MDTSIEEEIEGNEGSREGLEVGNAELGMGNAEFVDGVIEINAEFDVGISELLRVGISELLRVGTVEWGEGLVGSIESLVVFSEGLETSFGTLSTFSEPFREGADACKAMKSVNDPVETEASTDSSSFSGSELFFFCLRKLRMFMLGTFSRFSFRSFFARFGDSISSGSGTTVRSSGSSGASGASFTFRVYKRNKFD